MKRLLDCFGLGGGGPCRGKVLGNRTYLFKYINNKRRPVFKTAGEAWHMMSHKQSSQQSARNPFMLYQTRLWDRQIYT
jgi:hypothetical protein